MRASRAGKEEAVASSSVAKRGEEEELYARFARGEGGRGVMFSCPRKSERVFQIRVFREFGSGKTPVARDGVE